MSDEPLLREEVIQEFSQAVEAGVQRIQEANGTLDSTFSGRDLIRLRNVEKLLLLFGGDDNEELMWRDGHWVKKAEPTGPAWSQGYDWEKGLSFAVNCSDSFWWATADAEDVVLPDDLQTLQAAKDDSHGHIFWSLLWVARKRKLRPMRAFFEKCLKDDDDKPMIELFNAVGPERDRASEG